MPELLMLSPAPVEELPGNEVVLDVRFVEGMKLHAQLWPGHVRCILWRDEGQINQPMRYSVRQLEFDLIVLDRGQAPPPLLVEEATVILAAADNMRHLDLPEQTKGRLTRLVYTVEQPLRGRIAAALAMRAPLRRRLGSAFWNWRQERRLRAALAAADGIQSNGLMTHRAYHRVHENAMMFLDNRLRTPMIARAMEQTMRAESLRSGAPLRLAWFGTMSHDAGLYDLVQVAFLLKNKGIDFTLDLYGEGEESPGLKGAIAAMGLAEQVRFHEGLEKDAQLIPRLKRNADMLVAPQNLPTPLASYIEAMGCGLPILCYNNRNWRVLQRDSQAGWKVRRGSVNGLVRTIERLNANREEIIAASQRAADYARKHSFEVEFAKRMTHLRKLARLEDDD